MIYFVRHGESQANVDNIFAGPGYPAPLSHKGREQAKAAGFELKSNNTIIDYIVASPMERAKETAMIIADVIDFNTDSIRYDDRLAEHDMGSLNGKTMIGVTMGRQITEAEGAESPEDFQRRVLEALRALATLPGNVLIVSHGGVGRIVEATRKGIELADFYDIAGYPNAKVILLDADRSYSPSNVEDLPGAAA